MCEPKQCHDMCLQLQIPTIACNALAVNLKSNSVQCSLPIEAFEQLPDERSIDQLGWLSPGASPSEQQLRQIRFSSSQQSESNSDAEDTEIYSDMPSCPSPDCSPYQSSRPVKANGYPGCPPSQISAPMASQLSQDTRTTMMMRNLPNDYTRDLVLQLLDSSGFTGRYDFFYLPMDFNTDCAMGYAFVNFITHRDAVQAKECLDGFDKWIVVSQKVLELTWSDASQGLHANIDRYRNSSVFHPSVSEKFQPLLFSGCNQVRFPPATKPILQPRIKTMHKESEQPAHCTKLFVSPLSITRPERIRKTIRAINSGSSQRLLSHVRRTLASNVRFQALRITGELTNVGQVCSFHTRLHQSIPDLHLYMDQVSLSEGPDGSIIWRVPCTGTQTRGLIPGLPIDVKAEFFLEATMRAEEETELLVFLQYDFQVAHKEPELDLDPKILKHRMGDCQPCAYFAFRADGCRQGKDCEFWHLCTKQHIKSKKKKAAKQMTRTTVLEEI